MHVNFYRFMDLCNAVNCRVDYISVHRYGGVTILFKHEFFSVKRVINLKDYYKNLPPGTAEHIMEMIDDLYRRWGSLFTVALPILSGQLFDFVKLRIWP